MDFLSPIIVPPRTFSGGITLDNTMAGGLVRIDSANAATVTVPSTLTPGFACTIIQAGAGVITYAAGSGATIRNINNHTRSSGQHSVQGILVGSSPNPILSGQTAS